DADAIAAKLANVQVAGAGLGAAHEGQAAAHAAAVGRASDDLGELLRRIEVRIGDADDRAAADVGQIQLAVNRVERDGVRAPGRGGGAGEDVPAATAPYRC